MRRLPPLSALRAFEAAARHLSFKRAAEELAVTPAAISHQIHGLEDHLGLRLFERRTRQVVLTRQAEELFPVLRDGFDAFARAVERLTRAGARATVKITATTAFTARWLVPRVARFQSAHPGIDLQLHASDEAVDLAASGVDLAIRYGSGPYPGMLAEPMLEDRFAPVANPSLLVKTPGDLGRVSLIHFEWRRPQPANPTWRTWFETAGIQPVEALSELRFSEESHAIQAAVAGQGVAMLSLFLVRDELEAGRLAQPFGPAVPGLIFHLLEQADRPRTPAVEAARNWLIAEFSAAT